VSSAWQLPIDRTSWCVPLSAPLPKALLIRIQDSALLRPGRLDRILYVGPPDFEARKDIFRIRFSKMAIEPDTGIEDLAFMVSRAASWAGFQADWMSSSIGRLKAVRVQRSPRYVRMQH
jgi:ATP-dependent 26S proteasome regulatory subunit